MWLSVIRSFDTLCSWEPVFITKYSSFFLIVLHTPSLIASVAAAYLMGHSVCITGVGKHYRSRSFIYLFFFESQLLEIYQCTPGCITSSRQFLEVICYSSKCRLWQSIYCINIRLSPGNSNFSLRWMDFCVCVSTWFACHQQPSVCEPLEECE